jgi:hypothetical protein
MPGSALIADAVSALAAMIGTTPMSQTSRRGRRPDALRPLPDTLS